MGKGFSLFSRRPRRLRQNSGVRDLMQETCVTVNDFIYPLFVKENGGSEDVPSMPGVKRHPISGLLDECRAAYGAGIKAVALFPVTPPEKKDDTGSEALNPDCLVLRAVRAVKDVLPELIVITDVALDPYTSHGHDGVLNIDSTDVDNDATVKILAQMAVVQAEAGVDWVAPCISLELKVLQSPQWQNLTQNSVLTYTCDFPVKKQLSPQTVQENNRLAKSFNVTSYPTQIILSPTGKVLDRRQGYSAGPVTPYVNWVNSFVIPTQGQPVQ